MKELTLLNFSEIYPDEASCGEALRRFREGHDLCYSRCGCTHLYWNKPHKSWICSHCRHETTLRSGTVMQGSKLPIRDWFAVMFLLTATKRAISAKEMQRQLGRKRYQPVWEMTHKLRDVMDRRDSAYKLHGDMEIDEGFFSTETSEGQKGCPLKRGRGSQRKTAVPVMAESGFPDVHSGKKRSTPKTVGHIKKMEVLDGLKASTEIPGIKQTTDGKGHVTTDGSPTYKNLVKDGRPVPMKP